MHGFYHFEGIAAMIRSDTGFYFIFSTPPSGSCFSLIDNISPFATHDKRTRVAPPKENISLEHFINWFYHLVLLQLSSILVEELARLIRCRLRDTKTGEGHRHGLFIKMKTRNRIASYKHLT